MMRINPRNACSLIVGVGLALITMGAGAHAATVRNIVLVHGAWVDGSGWRPVYDILVKDGYRVTVVQEPLTGFPMMLPRPNGCWTDRTAPASWSRTAMAARSSPRRLMRRTWWRWSTWLLTRRMSERTKLRSAKKRQASPSSNPAPS